MKRPLVGIIGAGAVVLAASLPAVSQPPSNNNNSAKLTGAVTVAGILEHEQAFQAIADGWGGGNRLSGNAGYEDSAEYVHDRLAAAGYDVMYQDFEYQLGLLADWKAPILDVVGGPSLVPGIAAAQLGGDFGSMFKSTAYGIDTTAPVWAIDLALDDPATTTSGCEATDFDGVPAGAIVVVQRGTCAIINKFLNAQAAGAAAVAFISAPRETTVRCSSTSTGSTSPRRASPWRPPPRWSVESPTVTPAGRPGSVSIGDPARTPRAT